MLFCARSSLSSLARPRKAQSVTSWILLPYTTSGSRVIKKPCHCIMDPDPTFHIVDRSGSKNLKKKIFLIVNIRGITFLTNNFLYHFFQPFFLSFNVAKKLDRIYRIWIRAHDFYGSGIQKNMDPTGSGSANRNPAYTVIDWAQSF